MWKWIAGFLVSVVLLLFGAFSNYVLADIQRDITEVKEDVKALRENQVAYGKLLQQVVMKLEPSRPLDWGL